MSKLYIVSTPIGNLRDITRRVLETLESVDFIACEDTRIAGKLLKYYKIRKPLISYFEHNEVKRIPEILKRIEKSDNVALVSDAGTPTISDPGYKLIRECIKKGIKIEALPGASAITTALVVSGFPTDKFLFVGYPPHKGGKRKSFFEKLSTINYQQLTIVMFESPHRILNTLKDIKDIFGDIDICICRELTKLHEEIRRAKISETIKHFAKVKAKGEITLLFQI